MDDTLKRLEKLDKDITGKSDVCSSGGPVFSFPESMKRNFVNFGIGLVVCQKGQFAFNVMGRKYSAKAGETVFIPEGIPFCVEGESEDMEIGIIIYKVDQIRDIVGNFVFSVHLYSKMSPQSYYVWQTGDEEDMWGYINLIGSGEPPENDLFAFYERKLLLLSLTYRLCSVFQHKYLKGESVNARKTETFLRLIRLIDKHFMSERGVEFYADKLCLSPKYLSGLSKSVCGYTVQELVFKAIIRKCISMLNGTNKTIQEISEEFNFPNPSSFGTFFKKQTGMSPQKYREEENLQDY